MISCEYIFGYDRSSYSQIDVVCHIFSEESSISKCIQIITGGDFGFFEHKLESIAMIASNNIDRCIERIYYLRLFERYMNGVNNDMKTGPSRLFSKESLSAVIEEDFLKRHIQEIPQNKTRKSL